MLYVRTSEDIKFKAKSWIDMFGTRGAKATGSIVNNTFRHSLDILLTQGSLVSSFFVAVWITAALRLSRLYRVRLCLAATSLTPPHIKPHLPKS